MAQRCVEQSWTRKRSRIFFCWKFFSRKTLGFANKMIGFLQSTFPKNPRHESKEPLPLQPLGPGRLKQRMKAVAMFSMAKAAFWRAWHRGWSRCRCPGTALPPPHSISCLAGTGYKCAFNWAPLLPAPRLRCSEGRLNARGSRLGSMRGAHKGEVAAVSSGVWRPAEELES